MSFEGGSFRGWMAGCISRAVLRYLGSSRLRNVRGSSILLQGHGQQAEKSRSEEAGPCFSLPQHQPPEETRAPSPDFPACSVLSS